jgi:predicted PurR-regulated permease PerM
VYRPCPERPDSPSSEGIEEGPTYNRLEPLSEDRRRVLDSPLVLRAAKGGILAWSLIGIVVLFFFFRYVVYPVRIIFPPLVVAMIVVYLLNPLVTRMERRGVARIWGTLITYVIALGVFGSLIAVLAPVVAEQVRNFGEQGPSLIDEITRGLRDVAGRVGIDIGQVEPGGGGVVDFLGGLVSFTKGVAHVAIVFVVGPILAFYLLVDLPKIKRGLRAVIPSRRRAEVESVMEKIGRAIGGFFRGQLLIALVVGLLSGFALWMVGLPFWAVVGLVAGLFNLIPLIGPFIAGIVAILIAFTTDSPAGGLLNLEPGLPLAIGSAVALLIVQQLDNHILSPNIVARTVNLHPVTVMLGLLAGGTLLGLWGMLLAMPVLATVKILLLHTWDTRMKWPPDEAGPSAARSSPATASPVDRFQKAKEPARATESRGSWWTNAMRSLLRGRSRPGEPTRPGDEAREPERTSGQI